MKGSFTFALSIAVAQAQQIIIPFASDPGPRNASSTPIATATASIGMLPFNANIPEVEDMTVENFGNLFDARTEKWESEVGVYEGDDNFGTTLSLRWPKGKGPDAPTMAPAATKEWHACAFAVPNLLPRINVTGSSNGSCYDLVDYSCLSMIATDIASQWELLANQAKPEDFRPTCELMRNRILLQHYCFPSGLVTPDDTIEASLDKDGPLTVRVYGSKWIGNDAPFLVAADIYSDKNKTAVRSQAVSRTWPIVVFETRGRRVRSVDIMCPSTGFDAKAAANPKAADPKGTDSGSGSKCGSRPNPNCKGVDAAYDKCCKDNGSCAYSTDKCSAASSAVYSKFTALLGAALMAWNLL